MSGQFIAAVCSLALMVSIRGAQGSCPIATLPVIANSINNGVPGTIAAELAQVIYTCNAGFRIAPGDPAAPVTTRTVMCTAAGNFVDTNFQCVPLIPSSCRDYFARDGLLPLPAIPDGTCTDVILDLGSGSIVTVECCKQNTATLRTRIGVVTGDLQVTACNAGTGGIPRIMPSTSFTPIISELCSEHDLIQYVIPGPQIAQVVATTRGCSQNVRLVCNAITGVALIVRYNGEPSGVIYGTNAFNVQGTDINLSHYTYTGGACNCATDAAPAVAAGDACEDGCSCTRGGLASASGGRDVITRRDITATNLRYITEVRASQHGTNAATPPGAGVIRVRGINCDETL